MVLTVTCLIPAWNEAARIGAVLQAVVGHPMVAEVIVIDDASVDDTGGVAAQSGARVLSLPKNGGQSAAVAAGLRVARGELVIFLDADLIGLTADHVTALLSPVLKGQSDATISLRQNAPRVWRLIGLDYISGERVMRRAPLVARLDRIAALRRFGLEVFLNDCWLQAGLRLSVVRWQGVSSPAKSRKQGLLRGTRADLRMLADIFATVPPRVALAQIWRLRRAAARRFPPAPHRWSLRGNPRQGGPSPPLGRRQTGLQHHRLAIILSARSLFAQPVGAGKVLFGRDQFHLGDHDALQKVVIDIDLEGKGPRPPQSAATRLAQ